MLTKIFLRSFFLQSVWNFERMQNLGFLYALFPALERAHASSQDSLKQAVLRHLNFFNTHPYMANLVLGISAAMEENIAKGESEKIGTASSYQEVVELKNHLGGPLAAMGDSLFWGSLRPLLALFAVGWVWLGPAPLAWIAPAFFLLFYNIPHLGMRGWGLWQGYHLKMKAIERFQEFRIQRKVAWLHLIGLVSIGLFLLLHLAKMPTGERVIALLCGLLFFLLTHKGLPPQILFYMLIAFGLFIGAFVL